jgi:hypothetical protein
MDDDGSGDLSKEEFIKGVKDTGLHLNDHEVDELFDRFDKDGSGKINYNEFLRALRVSLAFRLTVSRWH